MQGLNAKLVWYATFSIGVYGAINALSEGRTDAVLMWLTWIGFFASLEFGSEP